MATTSFLSPGFLTHHPKELSNPPITCNTEIYSSVTANTTSITVNGFAFQQDYPSADLFSSLLNQQPKSRLYMISAINIFLAMLLLASLIAGLAGVQALPVSPVFVSANTAICSIDLTSTNHGSAMANYSVQIGRPFIEGAGCKSINKTLTEGVDIGVYQYACFSADNGATTNLSFVSATGPSTNIEVVESLQKAYPMVPFQKSRICLMNGVKAPDSWSSKTVKRGFFSDLKGYFEWMADSLGLTSDKKKVKRDPGFFDDLRGYFEWMADSLGITSADD